MGTRDRVLSILKAQKGNWVSGEYLSAELNVTRAAVWKHISGLKAADYLIDSVPRKGYRLKRTSPKLLPEEIREGLQTQVFGRGEIAHLDEAHSTNQVAKDLALRGAPEGSIVLAERQTEGRGRRGRVWFSPPEGGIYLTVLLRPRIPPGDAPRITLLTGVALAECLLESTNLSVTIKWPNDILLKGRKLAGILTELSAEMDAVNYVLVGVGINVNIERFPAGLEETATSVMIETGSAFSRVAIIRDFLNRFEDCYLEFGREGFERVLGRWKELSHLLGHFIVVETIRDRYEGKVEDVDEDAALILRDNEGRRRRIISGDIALVEETR